MKRSRSLATLAAVTGGLLLLGSLPAQAHGHGHDPRPPVAGTPVTVAEHLLGPLTFDVDRRSRIVVGQAFGSTLTLIRPGQAPEDLVTEAPGTDIAAVSTLFGSITWAQRLGDQESVTSSLLFRRSPHGTVKVVADLLAYERKANPDGKVGYAFRDLAPDCAAGLTPPFAPYTGGIDSHAYGSLSLPGVTYVADAGSNALLKVDHRGRVSTVAVLPAASFLVTADLAGAFGLPDCVVGHKYYLESVPTDVELGPDGYLYVSSLPGGPEDGSLGPLGSVYRVNPWTGSVKLLATGFDGATNVAVAPDGTVYVAELVGNEVSSISRKGVVTPLISLVEPAGLEWANGRLYVSTGVFGDGSIVSVKVK